VLDKESISKALISMIVEYDLPFRFVEKDIFHQFYQTLNLQIIRTRDIISSHSTVKTLITNKWVIEKDIVKKRLQSTLSTIHISIDIWTVPNRIYFLGLYIHFVDFETESLSKALIGIPTV